MRDVGRRAVLAAAVLGALLATSCEMLKKPAAPKDAACFAMEDADVVATVCVGTLASAQVCKEFAGEFEKLGASMKTMMPGTAAEEGAKEEESFEEGVKEILGVAPDQLENLEVWANIGKERVIGILQSKAPLAPPEQIMDVVRKGGQEAAGALPIPGVGEMIGKAQKIGTHAGVDLYGVPGEEDMVLAFVGDKTIVAGSAELVKQGLDRRAARKPAGTNKALSGLVAKAPKSAAVVVAVIPPAENMKDVPDELKDLESVLVWVEAGEASVGLNGRLAMKCEEGASKLAAMVQAQVDGMKQQLGPMLAMENMKPLKELLDGLVVKACGGTAEMGASLKPQVVQAVMPIVMQLMMGAMGGQGGPPMMPSPPAGSR